MQRTVRVFAPASVGNIGPGFDVLGMALSGMGDTVTATRLPDRGVVIAKITGDKTLSYEADKNTAGIVANVVLTHCQAPFGVSLVLHKGVPGSGLGSSAASAVAAAYAVSRLFSKRLSKQELIPLAATAEEAVSGGYFLDNIAASMMGGIVWNHPETKEVIRLGHLESAVIVLAIPSFRLLTKEARKVLPQEVPLPYFVANMASASMMAWSVARKDLKRFGQSIHDRVVEPARAPLIQGFYAVQEAAYAAGALGCSISGAGATVFAVAQSKERGFAIGHAMQKAFGKNNVTSVIRMTGIDPYGVRIVC